MSEISKYEAYKKKLQGLCDEHDLVFRFKNNGYPITLTIKPVGGLDAQMSLLEQADEHNYTSPDASIRFTMMDGALTYKMSKTFTIDDALFAKIKNLFKNKRCLGGGTTKGSFMNFQMDKLQVLLHTAFTRPDRQSGKTL